MANTIMTAKNSFAEGLIMDFAPDNTQATCMTSALNATLLTFNGNEMSLLNDMGNGRVETAYLPEGYIPVGTCEFGDIIYIVSYNPLTNKSLIGCFPSPERNISSEEMSLIELSIYNSEFLGNLGILKRTSIKKVLIEKKLNPGDKYVIYTDSPNGININSDNLSDYGQGKHNVSPKYLKLHVVSIEDSGKITYLDSSTKWYGDYYVNTQKNTSTGKPDIDSYRNLLSSGWSIFSSKVPGKLAILAELETIDSFSCSYIVDMVSDPYKEGNIIYKEYKIKLIPSYDSKEKLAAPHVCATKATFNNEAGIDTNNISFYSINSNSIQTISATNFTSSINLGWKNVINGGIIELEGTFKVPYKEVYKDKEYPIYSDSFIYNLEVTPAMDFGRLDYLKVLLTIDFNKIGTGDVDFNLWKYHNSEEGAMLTFGINTYPKPGYDVKCIVMDFYDNQGKVMQYLLDGRKSYNGVFNEYFSLNGKNSNSRMSRYDIDDITNKDWSIKPSEWKAGTQIINGEYVSNNLIIHKGNIIEEALEFSDEYIKETVDGETIYYQNDSGVIYYGALYAVKIRVYQGIINDGKASLEEINNSVKEPEPYYRWYWTNPMFNEYYYNTNDFGNLNFELILDSQALFESIPDTYIWNTKEINNLGNDFGLEELYKTYSANILYIGKNKDPNINMYVRAGLKNDYGCFNLHEKELSKIKTEIYLSTGEINYNLKGDEYVFSNEYGNISDPWFLYKPVNIVKTSGNGLSGMLYLNQVINKSKVSKKEESVLLDDFNITFPDGEDSNEPIKDDNDRDVYYLYKKVTLNDCYYLNDDKKKPLLLCMAATIFNKAYVQNTYSGNVTVPVYTPIINSIDDFYLLGISSEVLSPTSVKLFFHGAINLNLHDKKFTITNFNVDNTGKFIGPVEADDDLNALGDSGLGFKVEKIMVDPSTNLDFIKDEWSYVSSLLPDFFLVYPGGSDNVDCYGIIGSGPYSYIDVTEWFDKHQNTSSSKANSRTKTEIIPKSLKPAFDIKNGVFSKISDYNAVAFLGAKFKDGFTVLNSAFVDTNTSGSLFNLTAKTGKEYENFAYLLYLLLSNTYHKNKRAADEEINLRNYVRNGDSDIIFTKNIVIKLSEETLGLLNNIIMRGMDFNEYVNLVKAVSSIGLDLDRNIKLKFLDSAVNNVLTINIKSIPMSFADTNVTAYIMRNNELIPSFNLANNTFYVYQNNELQTFLNKILIFDILDTSKNLKHLFTNTVTTNPEETVKLEGVHPTPTLYKTEFLDAYNNFVNDVNAKVFGMVLNIPPMLFDTPELVRDQKLLFISKIIKELPTTYGQYRTEQLLRHAYEKEKFSYTTDIITYERYGWFGAFEVFFDNSPVTVQDPLTLQNVIKHSLGFKRGSLLQEQSYSIPTEYSFNCGFHLTRAFLYDTKLVLNTERTYPKFGIKANVSSEIYDLAYGGFMQDVIIDKEFQVVP